MSADLHIHIFEGITEKDLEYFFCNSIDSKYFDLNKYRSRTKNLFEKIDHTPNIWIGSVSWLKAGLTEDNETYIPETVNNIKELIGENLPELTDELISEIINAFDSTNVTSYDLANKEDVSKFLKQNKGKRIFTVSW